MKHVIQIALYSLREVSRNMWVFLYSTFFALVTFGLIQFQANTGKVAISLMSLCLVLIPLVSVLFGTMHFYNLREFTELMLTQPVKRRSVYVGMYLGQSAAMIISFVIGIGMPLLIFGIDSQSQVLSVFVLMIIGSILTLIFLAISFLIAAMLDDRGKGIAAALSIWLVTALLYDGMVLFIATAFSDYPLEKPLLVLSLVNPIDVARVTLLVQSDLAALMGYTGAVFERFFGTSLGITIAALSLVLWMAAPLKYGLTRFQRKDF